MKMQAKVMCFPVSNKTGEWQTTLHRCSGHSGHCLVILVIVWSFRSLFGHSGHCLVIPVIVWSFWSLFGHSGHCLVILVIVWSRDVKFVFFPNSNFVFKIRILFELRSGPK